MKRNWPVSLAGAMAGLVNGIFGGGGGMVLTPLLSRFGQLPDRLLYPTCVAIIFPVCLTSAAVYLFQGAIPLSTALPYLLGGAVGGYLGGKLYQHVPTKLLRLLLTGFLVYAAVRYLR